MKLAETADVVVENYRPDVKHRLGVDYEAVKAINPGIVYASISGFGQDGPYGNLPGFDQVAQGMGGLMSITGLPGQGPVRAGIPVADLSAGLFAALGVLTALVGRAQTGEGRWVYTSLLEAQITMLDFQAERWLLDKDVPQQAGNNHPTGIPTGVFKTTDGHINIAATGDAIYKRFCAAMGREDWLTDPRYDTPRNRSVNRDAMNVEIEAITRTRTSRDRRRPERPAHDPRRVPRRSDGQRQRTGPRSRGLDRAKQQRRRRGDIDRPLAGSALRACSQQSGPATASPSFRK